MAEVIVTAMLPMAGSTTWEFFQGIVELSRRLKANHLRLVAKMKTLCAQRDDMKDITNKHNSIKDRTIDDWFSKVKDIDNIAQELEQRFRRKQKKLTMIYVRSRSILSKEMSTLCLEIDSLIHEGYLLRNVPILQGALSEIQQDLKAIRAPKKFFTLYICICVLVLLFSCLFILLGCSHIVICPTSCYDDGIYPRVTRFISSVSSGSRVSVCSPSCYDQAILPRVTRFISSLIRRNHETDCPSGCQEVGVFPKVAAYISSLISGSHVTVCPPSCQYESCVFPWVPKYILNVIANIWK